MDTLKKLITELIALLAQYLATQAKEPPRPDTVPPEIDEDPQAITEPVIQVVKGVKYKTHGKFKTKSGKAKGLVVHYTVSGRSQAAAKNVVAYLAKEGLGCPVMDENGVIYVPEGFNYLTDVAYHAGSSAWKGTTGISAYCIGMEICNWGTAGKEKGAKDLRLQGTKSDNIKPGTYQMYTLAQERALINLCLWLKKNNPDFDFDWVVGHDEIAPTRKSDPGASLSMTMPQLRKLLKG